MTAIGVSRRAAAQLQQWPKSRTGVRPLFHTMSEDKMDEGSQANGAMYASAPTQGTPQPIIGASQKDLSAGTMGLADS